MVLGVGAWGRAVYRWAVGSMTFLLKFHSLSHSMRLEFFEAPIERMNCLSPATVMPRLRMPPTCLGVGVGVGVGVGASAAVMPRLRMPPTVGKRGSSQPSALPG